MKKLAQYWRLQLVFTKKTFLIMKISTLLLFIAMHVSAKDYAQQKITLNVTGISFKAVLKTIENQTTYRFFYSDDMVKNNKPVNIIVNDASIEKVMEILLDNSALAWRQIDANKIIISPVTTINYPVSNIGITGTVKNSKGENLKGVAVKEAGTNNIVQTNEDGSFSISVKDNNSKLEITSVGYRSQFVNVGSSVNFQIILQEETKNLDEVVVVGYGTKAKKGISTSISSITSKEITAAPVADAAQALQGRVAGVVVTQGSGAPGGTGGSAIRIRGISSLTQGNNPLIVVDGYPLPDQNADNVLNSFGTGEIERIDVLKDAGATTIYGIRGTNGVIVITTKRGKAGKSSFNVDVYRGIQNAWRLPTMLNAREYAVANTEARVASGLAPIPKLLDPNIIESQYGQGTDWLDKIFRRAAIQSVTMTGSGGSENAQYLFSAGYFKQDGIVYKTDFERFNLRFNGDVKVNNRIKIGNSLSLNKYIEYGTDTYTPFNSNIILALTAPPTVKDRNDDGTYAGGLSEDSYAEPNPIYNLEVPKNKNVKYRATGNIYAEVELLRGLKLKTMFGGDFTMQELTSLNIATPSTGGRPFILSGYFAQKSLNPDYLAEYTLTYDKVFAKKHKLNAVAGYTFQESRFSFLNGSRGNSLFAYNVPGLNPVIFTPTSLSQIDNAALDGIGGRLASYIARVNYDFDNRGYLGLSLRRDGSDRFAPGNKFSTFYAVSAAWRLTQEPFLQNVSWVNELKVRGSVGTVGNQNIEPYNYLQSINQSFQYTLGNSSSSGGIVNGAAPSRSFNPDIRWEKNEQIDLGFDASLFKNRLNINFDAYQRRSKDLIIAVAPPLVSGTFESVFFNTGTLQNRGIDLTLSGNIYEKNKFSWNANSVLSTYRNKVVSLGVSSLLDNGGFPRINGGSLRTTLGQPANYFYGFVTEGIFQNYKEIAAHAVQTPGVDPTKSTAPGDIKFKDLNGDGVINNEDRTNIGNSNPTFTYGLTNTFTYKSLELAIFIQGSQGNKVLNFTRWYTEGGVSNGNYSNAVLARWTGEGTSNSMPRLIQDDPNGNNRVSDRFVEDASYLRIKNLRLSYAIPTNFATKLNVKNTRFYVSAQNLLTVTNYSGFDPEVGGGVDYGFYPQARTFLAGITIDL
jgi:TonB-linked SusC/RagA family outer membrane protein